MKVMTPKKEIPGTKKNPEKVGQSILSESLEISRELSALRVNSNIDDTISSIIIKRFDKTVKERPLKKGESNIHSEIWIG